MSRVDCKSYPLPDAETLRDRFAMAALPALIDLYAPHINGIAKEAYEIADAMMEARK